MRKLPITVPLCLMGFIYLMNAFLERSYGVYERWPWFDIPMHFVGGVAAGLLGLALHLRATSAKQRREVPGWHQMLFVIGFTMIVAVAWEWHEFVRDWLHTGQLDWTKMQPSSADTMKDLLMGFFGGLTVSLSVFRKE